MKFITQEPDLIALTSLLLYLWHNKLIYFYFSSSDVATRKYDPEAADARTKEQGNLKFLGLQVYHTNA